MYQQSQLLGLIGQLYDCALEPQAWRGFLKQLSEALNSPGGIFFIQNPKTNQLITGSFSGLDPDGVEEYNEYYVGVDLRLKSLLRLPEGSVGLESTFVPDSQYRRSEFLNDFLLKYGFYHVLGSLVLKDPSAVSVVAIQRQPKQGPFERREVEFLKALCPHLKRASQLTLRLAEKKAYEKGLAEALDYLSFGVALVNEEAKVLAMNRPAQAIVKSEDGLSTIGGRLSASRPRETLELRRLIAEASRTSHGEGLSSGGALALPRPSLLRPLSVLVTPVPSSEFHDGLTHPTAVVFVTDPEQEAAPAQDILMRLYCLTRAEARLAAVMMEGVSVREAADRLRLGYETCRSQLKNVFLKTDTFRQGELIRLLLTGPAGLQFSAEATEADRNNGGIG